MPERGEELIVATHHKIFAVGVEDRKSNLAARMPSRQKALRWLEQSVLDEIPKRESRQLAV